MATARSSKLVQPFLPSLLHLSAVKVAVELYNGFEMTSLVAAFENIEIGTRMASLSNYYGYGDFSMWMEIERAREKLIFIPMHLRKEVMEAVHGSHCEVLRWLEDHPDFMEFKDVKSLVCFRSTGIIDRVKTAEQFILNANIDIKKRLELACMYCLENSIKALWEKIKESGETLNCETVDNPVVRFWVQWIHGECRVPWRQAAAEFFTSSPHYFQDIRCSTLFSAFFPDLPLKQRQNAYQYLPFTEARDFRQCLFSMTKEEEEYVLKGCHLSLLYIYTLWPQRRLFLEIAEELMKFMNARSFMFLLRIFFSTEIYWETFDYYELFLGLWNMSPIHFREIAEENPDLRKSISSCLKKIKRNKKISQE